jgi:hypothetical protein
MDTLTVVFWVGVTWLAVFLAVARCLALAKLGRGDVEVSTHEDALRRRYNDQEAERSRHSMGTVPTNKRAS